MFEQEKKPFELPHRMHFFPSTFIASRIERNPTNEHEQHTQLSLSVYLHLEHQAPSANINYSICHPHHPSSSVVPFPISISLFTYIYIYIVSEVCTGWCSTQFLISCSRGGGTPQCSGCGSAEWVELGLSQFSPSHSSGESTQNGTPHTDDRSSLYGCIFYSGFDFVQNILKLREIPTNKLYSARIHTSWLAWILHGKPSLAQLGVSSFDFEDSDSVR